MKVPFLAGKKGSLWNELLEDLFSERIRFFSLTVFTYLLNSNSKYKNILI